VNKSTQISSDDLDFNVFDDEIIENLVEKILKYGFLEVWIITIQLSINFALNFYYNKFFR